MDEWTDLDQAYLEIFGEHPDHLAPVIDLSAPVIDLSDCDEMTL